jgi:hypothetical protein
MRNWLLIYLLLCSVYQQVYYMFEGFKLPAQYLASEMQVFYDPNAALTALMLEPSDPYAVEVHLVTASYAITMLIVKKKGYIIPITRVHQRQALIDLEDLHQFLDLFTSTYDTLQTEFTNRVIIPHLVLSLEPGIDIQLRELQRNLIDEDSRVEGLTSFLDLKSANVYLDPSAGQLAPLARIFGGARMIRVAALPEAIEMALVLDANLVVGSEA